MSCSWDAVGGKVTFSRALTIHFTFCKHDNWQEIPKPATFPTLLSATTRLSKEKPKRFTRNYFSIRENCWKHSEISLIPIQFSLHVSVNYLLAIFILCRPTSPVLEKFSVFRKSCPRFLSHKRENPSFNKSKSQFDHFAHSPYTSQATLKALGKSSIRALAKTLFITHN